MQLQEPVLLRSYRLNDQKGWESLSLDRFCSATTLCFCILWIVVRIAERRVPFLNANVRVQKSNHLQMTGLEPECVSSWVAFVATIGWAYLLFFRFVFFSFSWENTYFFDMGNLLLFVCLCVSVFERGRKSVSVFDRYAYQACFGLANSSLLLSRKRMFGGLGCFEAILEKSVKMDLFSEVSGTYKNLELLWEWELRRQGKRLGENFAYCSFAESERELSRGDREIERVCVRKRRVDEQGLVGTCFLQRKYVQRNELFKAIFL